MSTAFDAAEAAILRLRRKFAGRSDPMALWVTQTLAALEKRIEDVADKRQKTEARQAGLVFIRTTLEEWAKKPPHSS